MSCSGGRTMAMSVSPVSSPPSCGEVVLDQSRLTSGRLGERAQDRGDVVDGRPDE